MHHNNGNACLLPVSQWYFSPPECGIIQMFAYKTHNVWEFNVGFNIPWPKCVAVDNFTVAKNPLQNGMRCFLYIGTINYNTITLTCIFCLLKAGKKSRTFWRWLNQGSKCSFASAKSPWNDTELLCDFSSANRHNPNYINNSIG